jgi:hypothetical protein
VGLARSLVRHTRVVRPAEPGSSFPWTSGLTAALALLVLAGAPAAQARAQPRIEISAPRSVEPGERFTLDITVTNRGDEDGWTYFIDIDVPVGVELLSGGFQGAISRGSSFPFDALGRAVHPLLLRDGEPVVVKGSPGNLLWVSIDQSHQLAEVGFRNRFGAELMVNKDVVAGRTFTIRVRGGFGRASIAGPEGVVVTRFQRVPLRTTQVTLAQIAASLASDPVFASPAAEPALDESGERRLEEAIAEAATPIYAAVLPATFGAPESLLDQLRRLSGLGGTFLLAVDGRYRGGSDRIAAADLERLLAETGGADEVPDFVLRRLVVKLDELVREPPAPAASEEAEPQPTAGSPTADGAPAVVVVPSASSFPAMWIVIGILAVPFAFILGRIGLRKTLAARRGRELVADAREEAEEDLNGLSTEIADLASLADGAGADPAVRLEYDRAVRAYDSASELLPKAKFAADTRAARRAARRWAPPRGLRAGPARRP